MKYRLAIVLLTIFACLNSSRAEEHNGTSSCEDSVAQFLSGPGKQTLAALERSEDNNVCWLEIGSNNTNLNRLLELVEGGNLWGATYLVEHLSKLDGGNLEDSLIALGKFGDHQAAVLLGFAKNGSLSARQLADALTMLPLSMSDDPEAQLKAMQKRRSRIAQVSSKDLSDEKIVALKSIDRFIAVIESHR